MCYLLGHHLTSKLGLDSPASAILAVIPILNSKINLLDSSKRDLIVILNKILASSDLTQDKAIDALRALAMIRKASIIAVRKSDSSCNQITLKAQIANRSTTLIVLLNVEMLVWNHLLNLTQQTRKIKWLKSEIISKVLSRNISYLESKKKSYCRMHITYVT